MSEQHWKTDRPETPEQALELLRFGAISALDRDKQWEATARTERRMVTSADVLERELTKLQERIAKLEDDARLASWTSSPDRMGGQFTPDEINGRETW